MTLLMRRPNEKEPLLTIPFTSSQTCSKGTGMDAYKVGHTSHQMRCVCVMGERRARGCLSAGTHPSLWLYIICPLLWSLLIKSINTSRPEKEKFSLTGIRPPELVRLTFVRMCVCVSQLVPVDFLSPLIEECSSGWFAPVGPSWISQHPLESQAAGIWASSSSSDGVDMNSDILIYCLQKETAAAGRSIIHYSC